MEKMSIPMTDRICFFGDGVYNTFQQDYPGEIRW